MEVYNYNPETGEYLGSEQAAVLPGRESVTGIEKYQIPANATILVPPNAPENTVAVFNGFQWSVVQDHRGETWYNAEREPVVIANIGDPADDGLTVEPAPYTQEELDAQAAQQRLGMQRAVQAERSRRLALGFDYDFGDARGVHNIGTTEDDWNGWNEVVNLANSLTAVGDTTTQINIVTNTGPTAVTSIEWHQLMLAGAAIRQQLWAASFALQAMSPIPNDYTDDSYWT